MGLQGNSQRSLNIPVKLLVLGFCIVGFFFSFRSNSSSLQKKLVTPPPGRQLDDCGRVTGEFYWTDDVFWPSPSFGFAKAHLAQRMEAWTLGPIANQSVWTAFNEQSCTDSRVGRNVDQASRDLAKSIWSTINATNLVEIRLELMTVLASAYDAESFIPPRGGWLKTKGIVFTASSTESWSRIITSLKLLRSYGTLLDAEVFYGYKRLPSAIQIETLRRLGAVVRSLDLVHADSSDSKAAAMVQASFEQVLFLNDDVLPVKDVTDLFNSPGYVSLGALLWSSVWKDSSDNPIWSLIGVQCRDEWSSTSSMVLINKTRHLDALLLTAYMARNSNYWFKFVNGEGNLLRHNLLGLRKRWSVPGRHVEAVGDVHHDEFCGTSMMYYDAFGKPAFLQQTHSRFNFLASDSMGQTQQLTLSPLSFFESTIDNSQSFRKVIAVKHDGNTTAEGQADVTFQGLGAGLLTTPMETRERALLERGLSTRVYTKGDRTCLNQLWSDWRTEAERNQEKVERELAIIALGSGDCAVPLLTIDYRKEHLQLMEWKEESLKNFVLELRKLNVDEGAF